MLHPDLMEDRVGLPQPSFFENPHRPIASRLFREANTINFWKCLIYLIIAHKNGKKKQKQSSFAQKSPGQESAKKTTT